MPLIKKYSGGWPTITFTAGADKVAGDVVVVGGKPLIVNGDVKNGDTGAYQLGGDVWTTPAATSQAWTLCDTLYWDATNSVCTTNAASGANKKIGSAAADKDAAAATGLVFHTPH